ncbi:HAD family hydrolase [Helicobacter sp. MIT 05-5293]|uniref:HAD family hydrolase n=1 Tax=Helicobacter sp. MIT 05-5293 TaxID=1548149 RepID=UPI00051D437F|nr:HAD family hydrolase [Helicobacter sp. MIT 05-5293]TLD81771.1 HAD family hydrolase [Helicobacter sp. MIT 05-5293]
MGEKSKKTGIILFDLDGTLIDSTAAIYASFCEAFERMGENPPSLESVKSCIGHTLEDMFLQNNVPSGLVSEYVEHYRKHYRLMMEEGTKLLDGVKDAIERAYEMAYLGVVTTKRGDFSRILLDRFGVGKYFDTMIGIESVDYPKPNAQPILKAIHAIESQHGIIQPERIFMVGDTPLDLIAAKNAKIQSVGVLCGYGKATDMRDLTPFLCEHVLDAVDCIAQRLKI